jgi:metal-dependent amidase/aminoacylase/carboxypeptidase family protein
VLGPDAVTETPQSLGGEDFAWYLHLVPGAMARLGTRAPGTLAGGDLHQPTFDIDERAIGVGVRVLAALIALGDEPPYLPKAAVRLGELGNSPSAAG